MLYNPPNVFDRGVVGFREEIKRGTIPAPAWMRRGSSRFLRWFKDQPDRWRTSGADEPDFLSTLENPRTLRYQQGGGGVFNHPQEEGPDWVPWQVEIARFVVPYGSVGLINSFEQHLHDLFSGNVWTSIGNWGNAVGPFGVYWGWVFRLDTFDGTVKPWLNTIVPTSWPGVAFPDLPEESGLWFKVDAAHLPVRWTVPGGYQLRVFFASGLVEKVRFSVACKVRGVLQSAYSGEARANLRRLSC